MTVQAQLLKEAKDAWFMVQRLLNNVPKVSAEERGRFEFYGETLTGFFNDLIASRQPGVQAPAPSDEEEQEDPALVIIRHYLFNDVIAGDMLRSGGAHRHATALLERLKPLIGELIGNRAERHSTRWATLAAKAGHWMLGNGADRAFGERLLNEMSLVEHEVSYEALHGEETHNDSCSACGGSGEGGSDTMCPLCRGSGKEPSSE